MKLLNPDATKRQVKMLKYDTLDEYRRHLRWRTFWTTIVYTVLSTVVTSVAILYIFWDGDIRSVSVPQGIYAFGLCFVYFAVLAWTVRSQGALRYKRLYVEDGRRAATLKVTADNSLSLSLVIYAAGDVLRVQNVEQELSASLQQLYFGSETKLAMLRLDSIMERGQHGATIFAYHEWREECLAQLPSLRSILQAAMNAAIIAPRLQTTVLRRFDDMVEEWYGVWIEQLDALERSARRDADVYRDEKLGLAGIQFAHERKYVNIASRPRTRTAWNPRV